MAKRGRYILKLEDRSRLRTVLTLGVSVWWLAAGAVAAVLLGGAGWLMGWHQAGGSADRLPADSREEVVDMLMRLDSLKAVVAVNGRYINNVSRLLDTGRRHRRDRWPRCRPTRCRMPAMPRGPSWSR